MERQHAYDKGLFVKGQVLETNILEYQFEIEA